ncbi:MAG: Arm DNA-binding domain-containing protein [Pseudomonadales bacterium]
MAWDKPTDAKIRSLVPKHKRYSVSDGGLFIEILPSGSRSWRMRYRFGGRQEKVSLGQYPTHGLLEAREWRGGCKVALARGDSPMQTKRVQKTSRAPQVSFETFVGRCLVEVVSKSDRDSNDIHSILDRDILPYIGHKRLHAVTANDVVDVVERIQARGSEPVAVLARTIIKRIYGFAIATRDANHNPGAQIEAKFVGRQRDREFSLTGHDI